MPSLTHEKMLLAGIEELKKQGFRIIRLDRRIIPDAIAIKEKEVIAIEASTNPTNVWLVKKKFESGSQYDAEIIITKPYDIQYHSPDTYYRVLELHKEEIHSYREIRRTIMKEFNLKTLSVSTIHDWIKGNKRPLTLLGM